MFKPSLHFSWIGKYEVLRSDVEAVVLTGVCPIVNFGF